MDSLAWHRERLPNRFQALVNDLAQSESSILFCQVWMAVEGLQAADPFRPHPFILRVQAKSSLSNKSESMKAYASLSELCGIRREATDLIGDCLLKGATRVIEDLEHADSTQHPRNLLPGTNIPACSALFVPIFDPANPFARQRGLGVTLPTAILEILVCETAKNMHHNSDLINAACEALDRHQFAINTDNTAFREWSKLLPPRNSGLSGMVSPSRGSSGSANRGLSRTCSTSLLLSSGASDSDDIIMSDDSFSFALDQQWTPSAIPAARLPMGVYTTAG